MSRFQLPKGLEGIDKLPETNRLLQNLFHTHDESNSILSRPGITGLSEPGGLCRGGFEWNGALYYIYSQQLIKIPDVTSKAPTANKIAHAASTIWNTMKTTEKYDLPRTKREVGATRCVIAITTNITPIDLLQGLSRNKVRANSTNPIERVGIITTLVTLTK